MLSSSDIEMMREWQDEIYDNRTHEITVVTVLPGGKDPITGIPSKDITSELNVDAVITHVSIRVDYRGGVKLQDGIEYEVGDLLVDIKLDYLPDNIDSIERFIYEGKSYKVITKGDKKGIGIRNRIEFLAREIT